MLKTLFLLTILLSSSLSFANCDLDLIPFHPLDGGRSLEDLSDVRMGSYNVLNLEFSPGKYLDNAKTGRREFVPKHITKDISEVQGIANVIKNENLDIIVMQEVEGKTALDMFNRRYLDNKYETFILPGNDSRGIEVAFLIKKDLPLKVKLTSNRDISWMNPNSGQTENIFSRDLPALHIWSKHSSGASPPGIVIFGTHLKSQRNRSNDFKSRNLRGKQAQVTKEVIMQYQKKYPKTPVLLAGDFNANIHKSPEFKPLFEENFLTDSFELAQKKLSYDERVTHTFHPRDGDSDFTQLDGILVTQNAKEIVKDAKVYRYLNKNGEQKNLPQSYEERKLNPSDHYPIIIKLDLQKVLE